MLIHSTCIEVWDNSKEYLDIVIFVKVKEIQSKVHSRSRSSLQMSRYFLQKPLLVRFKVIIYKGQCHIWKGHLCKVQGYDCQGHGCSCKGQGHAKNYGKVICTHVKVIFAKVN